MVRVVDQVVLELADLLDVIVGDCVTLDTYFFDEVTQFPIRSLVQVLEQTVFELCVVLHCRVGWQLLLNRPSNDVLIPEHVPDGALVNWHALFLSVI